MNDGNCLECGKGNPFDCENAVRYPCKDQTELTNDRIKMERLKNVNIKLLKACKSIMTLLEQGQGDTITLEHDGKYLKQAISKAEVGQ